ncbi:MAG: hypothetical protein RR390_00400 [Hafnia sp.]
MEEEKLPLVADVVNPNQPSIVELLRASCWDKPEQGKEKQPDSKKQKE